MQWPSSVLGPEQMIALINAEIIRQIGKQLLGQDDLVDILVDMRLDVDVRIFAGQRLGHFHLLGCVEVMAKRGVMA